VTNLVCQHAVDYKPVVQLFKDGQNIQKKVQGVTSCCCGWGRVYKDIGMENVILRVQNPTIGNSLVHRLGLVQESRNRNIT